MADDYLTDEEQIEAAKRFLGENGIWLIAASRSARHSCSAIDITSARTTSAPEGGRAVRSA
jgi:hypothetical protein